MNEPTFPRPRVLVSRCMGFARCRWNGLTISDDTVEALTPLVTFAPVCPEVRIGLGVPRDPIRVVLVEGERRLIQPATGRDVTDAMRAFAAECLDLLGDADGVLLKSRSPSCGIKDVKVYATADPTSQVAEKGAGFFGEAVLGRLDRLAVEDEGRLHNFLLRDHFYTKLFALAAFREMHAAREAEGDWGLGPLVAFQARTKSLLLAYHEPVMREMGRVVANHAKRSGREVYARYRALLSEALARPAKYRANINVLMHALGHVSDGLTSEEKAYFLDTLEQYRRGKVPLSVPKTLVRSWAVRFEKPTLTDQTFFAPYPEALVAIHDSGKGRGE